MKFPNLIIKLCMVVVCIDLVLVPRLMHTPIHPQAGRLGVRHCGRSVQCTIYLRHRIFNKSQSK